MCLIVFPHVPPKGPCVETVKSSREIERMFAEGTRAAHPLLIALVTKTPTGRGPGGRVAFIAGKKLGGAVVRNRAKRLLREAVRRAGGPWGTYDVALIARPALSQATPAEIDAAMSSVLERSGVR